MTSCIRLKPAARASSSSSSDRGALAGDDVRMVEGRQHHGAAFRRQLHGQRVAVGVVAVEEV
jgi:hypothetical protein